MEQEREINEVHVININELIISMRRKQGLDQSSDRGSEEDISNPLIHKIYQQIRHKPNNAFLPYILSIGPYNHGIPSMHAMQQTKYKFLNHIVNMKHRKGLQYFLGAINQLEKQARRCYADEIAMDRNEFLKMLLLDGCYVLISLEGSMQEIQEQNESNGEIEVTPDSINTTTNRNGVPEDEAKPADTQFNAVHEVNEEDYASSTDLIYSQHFWHDILLLENQIPFFVIETIHQLITGGSNSTSRLVENVVESVECVLGSYPKAICKSSRPKDFHHLLHLCHLYFKPCSEEVESRENHMQSPTTHNFHQSGTNFFSKLNQRPHYKGLNGWQQACPWRRATEYHQAGISFKQRTFCSDNPHSLLDIVFHNGMMEIPCLNIDPNTYSLFCNLIAFEQTCPHFGSFVTTYVIFLSRLISMPEDVSILTERGIIVHHLNSDAEVSDIFKGISECIVYDFDNDSYLKSLS